VQGGSGWGVGEDAGDELAAVAKADCFHVLSGCYDYMQRLIIIPRFFQYRSSACPTHCRFRIRPRTKPSSLSQLSALVWVGLVELAIPFLPFCGTRVDGPGGCLWIVFR
jgi:hypothetical protein